MELVKDYDYEILYCPGKGNIVVYALSSRGPSRVGCIRPMIPELATELSKADIELVIGRLANITLESTLLERIREYKLTDSHQVELREKVFVIPPIHKIGTRVILKS